ncbi:plastocyanin/azurin family copper-binding protein [Leeia oryzae]|uniref:plastocyanin/azurin family copper-binding protein n=1 Tax=Leeia oryzae TaxID=356662 RepID=UPI00037E970D|nr:plastocyanin/azurin family copper-binding protein [Leeia oryzae]
MKARLTLVSLVLFGFGMHAMAANPPQVIKVLLTDTSIKLDAQTVKPGKVMFDVINSTDSKMPHEMVVLHTDQDDSKLPVKGARVEEGKFKNMGEAHDMKPGVEKKLAMKLKAGHYDLICNIPGHYAMGMHTSLQVVP